MASAVPALALVAANASVMLGPAVQLAAVLCVFALALPWLRLDLSPGAVALSVYVGLCLALAVWSHGAHQAVIKAGKLGLFCLASMLFVRGAARGDRFPALVALRAFFVLCGANVAFALATGQEVFRGSYLIEFSIYSSYTIAILFYLARPRAGVCDRALAWGFSLQCGSTMGLLLLILAEVIGRSPRPRVVLACAALAPLGLAVLRWMFEARGKELTWSYLATSDRARLVSTFGDTVLPRMSLPDWLFGLGPGEPLHRFISPDAGFDGYLLRLGEDGIYAFCLHNEALRILCDFGLVGLALVCLRLWANCSLPVLVLLAVCMTTNSYLYSFSGALVASSLFNAPALSRAGARSAPAGAISQPHPQHA